MLDFNGKQLQYILPYVCIYINQNIDSNIEIEILSKLDTNSLEKASFYYNFTNYSLLAGCVFVISTVLNSFKSKTVIPWLGGTVYFFIVTIISNTRVKYNMYSINM